MKYQIFIRRWGVGHVGAWVSVGRQEGAADVLFSHEGEISPVGMAIGIDEVDEVYASASINDMLKLQTMLAIALQIAQNFEPFWRSPVEFIYSLPEAIDHEIYFQDDA